ncbi:ribosome maturation factor RimM [Anaerosphaera multitolerans]|uniref:Ribosome maturation factor RimM n=1 Tax=Anaerosphaera multitolerans TaxID=2487351 RepID=A0A437S877_9FIRM|nr:ribosome maturation factor RimM [Anaerosphaera multitolerans]RVU55290.1 16S rRNA processing protein RimM [Anaerosphaera multitolerans]
MKKSSEHTIIGKIINTRGIKGELKIFPMTGSIERFSQLKTVFVGESLEACSVEKVIYESKFVYLKLKEFNNINDVLKFKDQYLYVKDSDRIKLEEGTYFISDIIGCSVYNTENVLLGKVVDVIENPVHDLYAMENENGQHLIPAIRQFIKEINIDSKFIIIDPIEGLIN